MKPIVLCILDGVGIRRETHGNAVKLAKMPTFHKLLKEYPSSTLDACEENVGLPKGQMGNSEVGHTNIGAGRIVYQPLEMINQSIKDGSFFKNEKLIHFMNQTKKLHILGLLSDGGIHSHINHLFALIDMAKLQGIEELYIHVFTDGRDTLPDKAINFLKQLEDKLEQVKLGKIASISGRYYAMDRDNNYERTKLCYDVITKDCEETKDYESYIKNSYENNIYDEFIKPLKVTNEGTIQEGDFLITFNFRPDRLRQLFASLTNPNFKGFETKFQTSLMTMFSVSDEVIYDHVFEHQNLKNSFGPYIDSLGLKQLRIAETEKYAHVTYFFDGGKEIELKGSNRILIPSPKVATYDLKPEMSALEITETLLKELDKDIYDVVVLNFANGDMVGHTGNLEATIQALECLDGCLDKLYNKIKEKNGILIVTADHGNSDYMLDDENHKITSHSMSKVPFIVTDKSIELKNGKLSDIAPTMLYLLNKEIPKEMTGNNLAQKKTNKKLFEIISFLAFVFFVLIYGFRFIYYYKVEHPKVVKDSRLSSKIIENNPIVSTGIGLQTIDSDYVFYGNVENNYVLYSNQLWRILKIDQDKNITLISDEVISSLAYGDEANTFDQSYIYKWLQNYYNSLNQPDYYLKEQDFCVASGKTRKDNCKNKFSSKIGLLAYYNYIEAGANNSYLNTNEYYWTLTPSTDYKTWYIFKEGGMNDKSYDGETYYSYGIRPVITLKEGINYTSGTGSKQDPYKVEEKNEIGIGSYIRYSENTWRVIKQDEESYYLALNNTLSETHIFSKKSSIYQKNDYNSLYYYLNNNYYQSLDKTLLLDGTWYTGEYNVSTKYDYSKIYESSIVAKVGLMNVADNFTKLNKEYATSTPYNEELITVIKENGNLYSLDIDEESSIRPVVRITNNFTIESGSGIESDPYVVGGK